MSSIGFFLILIGFGSLILERFGMTFKILFWADPYQPWVGLIAGIIGIILVAAGFLTKNNEEPAGTE